jgi:hypothetical protein
MGPHTRVETTMKPTTVKPTSAWWCENCQTKEMTHAEMLEHLKTVHGLETKGLKCSKKMLTHLDGDTWFSSTYEVTVKSSKGEIKMTNSTCNPRHKDDPMRYP